MPSDRDRSFMFHRSSRSVFSGHSGLLLKAKVHSDEDLRPRWYKAAAGERQRDVPAHGASVAGRRLQRPRQGRGLGGGGLGLDGVDRKATQPLGVGAEGCGAATLPEGLHRIAEEVGGGEELFVDGPEPQDGQGL